MVNRSDGSRPTLAHVAAAGVAVLILAVPARAQTPAMTHPRLAVREVVAGLVTPTSLAVIDEDEMFVLEKNTGRVQHVAAGAVHHTALDLAVNFASERGLLGIALHPDFAVNGLVYLYWTESTTGADTNDLAAVPLLGNRVDRFVWDGASLAFDLNLVHLRALQEDGAPFPPDQGDEGQPPPGNHDGGVLAFGSDGMLYVFVGDVGRRSQMQNLPSGPTATGLGPTVPDDQFGGPQPDDAHFTGVILRLDDAGAAPEDNPFYATGAATGGEVGANLQKVFAYGLRNSFGMAFDPISGRLWLQENGDDSFDELNLVEPGFNSGWAQLMGPSTRVAQFKAIETSSAFFGLQQLRWPPTRIADTAQQALARLLQLPGAHYSEPEFSWKYALAPGGLGFAPAAGLGPSFAGDLFMGFSVPAPLDGPLFRFNLTGNRRAIAVDGKGARDRVADNRAKRDLRESEEFLIGTGFGVVTDIEPSAVGTLYVVSLSHGKVYEVYAK